MGTGFDVASAQEMQDIMGLGANPNDLIFANPMKSEEQILEAKKHGVKKMTFDSIEELEKIAKSFPKAECILRIAVNQTTATYDLSEKYGAALEDVDSILKASKKLGLYVKGVAFHVGSGGVTFEVYKASIIDARKIFDKAEKMGLKKMDFLDIGGGFSLASDQPTPSEKKFDHVAVKIQAYLEEIFPEPNIRIIAEPGRYIAEGVGYLVSQIIGQKILKNGAHHYYVNNGIYQGYSIRVFGEDQYCKPVSETAAQRKKFKTTLWGQTCDSCDFIFKDRMYPEQKTGEWIFTYNFGAYNKDCCSRFNGFELPNIIYI